MLMMNEFKVNEDFIGYYETGKTSKELNTAFFHQMQVDCLLYQTANTVQHYSQLRHQVTYETASNN